MMNIEYRILNVEIGFQQIFIPTHFTQFTNPSFCAGLKIRRAWGGRWVDSFGFSCIAVGKPLAADGLFISFSSRKKKK